MSQSKKFQKIAAPPRRTPPAPSAGATTPASSTSTGSSSSSSPTSPVSNLLEFFSNMTNKAFGMGDSQKFSPEEIKEALGYLAALIPGWNIKERYKPSAFIHALEMDKNRGYKDTALSQGAYEMRNPELQKELEDFKKNAPSNMKDLLTKQPIENLENINLDESSDRYKDMREKLFGNTTASASSKFVKTSQTQGVNEFSKLVPKWDMNDVLQAMAKVAIRQDLSTEEKREGMTNVLSQYEREMAPLSQYFKKNDIKYK
jgi:hypothetical protein